MITFTPLSEPYGSSSTSNDGGIGGSENEQPRALAYLAEVDDVRILIDCGAPEMFRFPSDGSGLDEILRHLAPTIDLVLLCHSSMSHLGLYAYAKARFGLSAPCYTTLPVATMGRLTILESAQTLRSENDFASLESEIGDVKEAKVKKEEDVAQSSKLADDPHWCVPTLDEINEAFEHVNTLRYLQPTQLEGKCAGLTLMAYNAGHTLGGAVWKMRSPSSGTLLIALDWNHIRERHIDGTALKAPSASSAALTAAGGVSIDSTSAIADAIRRPDLLITSMARSTYENARRKDRDAAFLDVLHNTIRGGHSVLIPIDAASRLLELLVLLDQHWAYAYPHVRFPLCLVSNTGREMVERARTLMEWMTKEWVRKNEGQTSDGAKDGEDTDAARKKQRTNRSNANNAQAPSSPLDFKYLRIFSSLNALDEALSPSDAKVILAWPPSLTHGPARKLVARMAQNERDVILLTGRGEPNTLTRTLYDEWERQQAQNAKWGQGSVGHATQGSTDVQLEIRSKVPLEGEELEAFNAAKRLAQEKHNQQRALLARSTRRAEADDDEASSDSGSSDDDSDQDDGMLGEAHTGDEQDGRGIVARSQGQDVRSMDDGLNGQQHEMSFDIYLKGNASRASTVFGSAVERLGGRYKTGVRYRTFPVVERKKRIDAYGETLDLSKWIHRRRQLEALGGEQAEAQTVEDQRVNIQQNRAQKEREEEQRRKEQEPPSKFVVETVNVQIRCKLFFVEMDGLADKRALRTIVPQLEPRRTIFVESIDARQRAELLQFFNRQHGMTKEIHMPLVGERVEIGESTASFTVNLGEEVMASLRFSNFQDYQVAMITARVSYRAESSIPMLEPVTSDAVTERKGASKETSSESIDQKSAIEPRVKEEEPSTERDIDVDALPSSDDQRQISVELIEKQREPKTLFIGDLKLSALKQSLAYVQKPGIPSEFVGQGTLVCGNAAFRTANSSSGNGGGGGSDDVVTVRKEGQGEIVIEGNASRTFYSVRDAVYSLHAQVTGQ